MCDSVSFAEPTFVSVKFFCVLVVRKTNWLPNEIAVGDAASTGWSAVPANVTDTLPTLVFTSRAALRVPPAIGWKATVSSQLAFGASGTESFGGSLKMHLERDLGESRAGRDDRLGHG